MLNTSLESPLGADQPECSRSVTSRRGAIKGCHTAILLARVSDQPSMDRTIPDYLAELTVTTQPLPAG